MFCFSFACRLWLDILIIFLWSILFIQLFFWISSSSFRNYPSGCDLSIQLYEQRKMIYWLKRLTMEVIKKENNRHLSFQIGIKQGHHMMLLLIFLAQEECSRPPITSFFTDITSNFRIAYLHDQVSSYFVISFLLLFSFFLLFFWEEFVLLGLYWFGEQQYFLMTLLHTFNDSHPTLKFRKQGSNF